MNSIFGNLFNGNLFGKVTEGLCKMDMSGRTAVRTSKGYKAYDSDKKALVNCSSFCFDTGVNMFFIVPTNKPKAGDIILKDGAPRYVLDVTDDGIKALDYETDVVETILPERHVFLGNTYFYGKVVNLMGKMFKGCGKGGMLKNIMLMKMLGGDKSEGSSSDMLQMLLMSKLMKDEDSPFEDLFECFDDDEEEDRKPAKKPAKK